MSFCSLWDQRVVAAARNIYALHAGDLGIPQCREIERHAATVELQRVDARPTIDVRSGSR